ncbi:hypothetical protein GCK32_013322 [Trichostrongylus colubriformis]|uniref:Uncharacterized protein n=2 Tax=Trichostrongylus colubriformis TaxID=6319 RepID=A0AAN8FR07_TRICO
MDECNNLLEIQRFLNAMGSASSMQEKSTSKLDHIDSDESSCASEHVRPSKRKRSSRRRSSLLDEQYEMIKAQRIAFEEQAKMYRSMRSFIEESTRTVRDLSGRLRDTQRSTIDSSPSESNLEFGPSSQAL